MGFWQLSGTLKVPAGAGPGVKAVKTIVLLVWRSITGSQKRGASRSGLGSPEWLSFATPTINVCCGPRRDTKKDPPKIK